MAEKILGPDGSRRRRRFLFVPVLLVAIAALLIVGGAQAVHDETFQLDGDAISSTTTNAGGHAQSFDWNSFFNSSGVASPALPDGSRPGFTASAFQRDFTTSGANNTFVTSDASTFSTGSKDTLDVTPGWQCGFSNNVNSKTDLSNVYATFYTDPVTSDQIVYFGLERNDNSGDGNIAFWFLQDTVGCTATPGGGNVAFSGHHKDGDVLVVSAFTNGGSISNISAYRWTIDTAHPRRAT